jgi:hypothetical protein
MLWNTFAPEEAVLTAGQPSNEKIIRLTKWIEKHRNETKSGTDRGMDQGLRTMDSHGVIVDDSDHELSWADARADAIEQEGGEFSDLRELIRRSNVALDVRIEKPEDLPLAERLITRTVARMDTGCVLYIPAPLSSQFKIELDQMVMKFKNSGRSIVFVDSQDGRSIYQGKKNNVLNIDLFLNAIGYEQIEKKKLVLAIQGEYSVTPELWKSYLDKDQLSLILLSQLLNDLMGYKIEDFDLLNHINEIAKVSIFA